MPLRNLPLRRWLSLVTAVFTGLILIALIIPAIQRAREAARRTQSRNQLHNIGLAFHNYHDVYDCLPPGGVVDADGTGRHGWMTFLLPYIDSAPVYDSIDFDRTWDDGRNESPFRCQYPAYLMPGVKEIATIEGYALSHRQGNPDLLHRNSHISLADLPAGLESTWLVGEAAGRYQPWGYPFNWRPLGDCLNCGPESYGRPSGTGAFFLFADGSVQFLSTHVPANVLGAVAAAGPQPDAAAVVAPDRQFECVTQMATRGR